MLVIGMNQTIDRTLRLPVLAAGHVLRATDVAVTAGGKAVNVCRAAATLGAPAQLVGPFAGTLGHFALDRLADEGLDVVAVEVAGEIRGTTIILEDDGRATVLNEPGPLLDDAGWKRVLAAIDELLTGGAVVAISGSVPPGTPDDAHRILIDLVHERGGRVAVDVTGDRLRQAVDAGADLVSPNLAEAEALSGTSTRGGEAVKPAHGDVAERARHVADALSRAGAGAAMVSAGSHGVAIATQSGAARWIDAPRVEVVNPIGAGDALLGSTLVSWEGGAELLAAVADGVAYAAASVAHPIGGYADMALVDSLRRHIGHDRQFDARPAKKSESGR